MMRSVDLYRTLEAEVGLDTGWREVGSLRLASSRERMEELDRQAGWAKTFGLPFELISATEARRLFPPMSTDGVLGAAYLPTDGYIDPSQLTLALAEGARRGGAEIATSTRVNAIRTERNRVAAVETDRGEIATELVVNAGGIFAHELGALAGVNVPVIPMAHEYLVTRPSGVPLDDNARPVAARVLPWRVRWPRHGWLRAQPRSVVARRDPRGLQRQAARRGLAAVRGADDERPHPCAGARGHGGRPADQRAGGFHAGRRVHSRPDRRPRILGCDRLLRARARRRRGDGKARRGVDRRGRPEPRRVGDGFAPVRAPLSEPRLHARAHGRDLLDVLRRQVPRPRAGGGPAPARLADVRAHA